MKIESLGKPAGPATATEARPRPSAPKADTGGEQVKLSSLASALQKAETTLSQTPPIDRARVEEIKQAIRDGQFKINPDRIADGLIDEVKQMFESKVGNQ